ncbi:hypothetical protein [Bacilliculturomica massiliensis]|uniref:hypothetical protein n=1 Tax=Bacilliculturomica massiliensis TaxID=1917867 RepID=UPI0010326B56|nr:hypothetical protein [Bacilliculturomica massiliensis]
MDMGDLTSRQIGEIMAGGLLRAEEALMNGGSPHGAGTATGGASAGGGMMFGGRTASQNQLAAMGKAAIAGISEADKGTIPSTIKNQNLGHNSKIVGLGPNTKQK